VFPESAVKTTYWPFKSEEQWKLAMWALFPTPLPRPRAERAIVAKYAVWAKPEFCFESWGQFQRLVQQVEAKGGEWRRKVLPRNDKDPLWYPEAINFYARNSLEILKELVADVKVAEHMKWAPEKVYNSKGERLYSELWTGDWWWRKQVVISRIHH
jgi:Plavaka transposase